MDGRWARLRAGRRMIGEEVRFRNGDPAPDPAAIAGTYRSLRKALEDSKDEPGAADFYYGEMEMRRLAAPIESSERWLLTLYWAASGYGLRASRAVMALLAVVVIAGGIFSSSAVVDKPPVQTSAAVSAGPSASGHEQSKLPAPQTPSTSPSSAAARPLIDPNNAMWPWLFASQEAVALFRPAGTVGVTLIGVGPYVALTLRILGPILLALAVLAIRNRTKR